MNSNLEAAQTIISNMELSEQDKKKLSVWLVPKSRKTQPKKEYTYKEATEVIDSQDTCSGVEASVFLRTTQQTMMRYSSILKLAGCFCLHEHGRPTIYYTTSIKAFRSFMFRYGYTWKKMGDLLENDPKFRSMLLDLDQVPNRHNVTA